MNGSWWREKARRQREPRIQIEGPPDLTRRRRDVAEALKDDRAIAAQAPIVRSSVDRRPQGTVSGGEIAGLHGGQHANAVSANRQTGAVDGRREARPGDGVPHGDRGASTLEAALTAPGVRAPAGCDQADDREDDANVGTRQHEGVSLNHSAGQTPPSDTLPAMTGEIESREQRPLAPAPGSAVPRAASARLDTWAAPALCVCTAGLALWSSYRGGGYFADDVAAVTTLTLVACAVGSLVVGASWRPSRAAVVCVGAALGLTLWSGLSASWSPDPEGAVLATRRDLGYAAFLLLALLSVGNGRRAALLVRLVVLLLVGVCVVALLSRLRPSLFDVDPQLLLISQGRLAFPVGYWNGLGAVAAMAVMGCLGLAADAREHAAIRAASTAGGTIAGCVLYLTISRGAGLALASALIVVLVLSPRRVRVAVSGVVMFAGVAAGVLVLAADRILVDRPGTLVAQEEAGRPVLVAVLAIALGAALVQIAVTQVRALNRTRSRSSHYSPRSRATTGYAVCGALVVALLVGVYGTSADTLEGQAANGTSGVRGFVDRQYDAFMDTSKPPPAGTERLSSARSSRSNAYNVAIDGFQAHPLAGDGAAGYEVRWYRERKVPESFRNAHSLELETASELGLVGLLLLVAMLAPLVAGMRGLRHARGGLTRSQSAAAGGIFTVWLVHSGLDWDWQLGSVTMPALACGAAMLAQGRRQPAASTAGMVARRSAVSPSQK